MTTSVITVGPGTFTIGEAGALTNFAGQVTELKVTPSVDISDPIKVLDGGTVQGDRTETWKVSGKMLQDLGATESKLEWLFDHAGEVHPFSYAPASALGKKITGELRVEAIEIGGEVNTKPQSDFEFDVNGRPEIETIVP